MKKEIKFELIPGSKLVATVMLDSVPNVNDAINLLLHGDKEPTTYTVLLVERNLSVKEDGTCTEDIVCNVSDFSEMLDVYKNGFIQMSEGGTPMSDMGMGISLDDIDINSIIGSLGNIGPTRDGDDYDEDNEDDDDINS